MFRKLEENIYLWLISYYLIYLLNTHTSPSYSKPMEICTSLKRRSLAWRTNAGVEGDGTESPYFEFYGFIAYPGHQSCEFRRAEEPGHGFG